MASSTEMASNMVSSTAGLINTLLPIGYIILSVVVATFALGVLYNGISKAVKKF